MRFVLERIEDASGVSGTGRVAVGYEFPDGQCVLWWQNHHTIGVYQNLTQIEMIHGHGGKTKIVRDGQ